MAIVTSIQTVLINVERNKYMAVLHEEISKLGIEFKRYQSRWNDFSKHMNTVSKDMEKIHVSGNKISRQFERIMQVELSDNNQISEPTTDQISSL